MKKTLAVIATALALMCTVLCTQISCLRTENRVLEENQVTLLDSIEHFTIDDSLSAVTVSRLQLDVETLAKRNTELEHTCNTLGVKVKRLQSASTASSNTEVIVHVPIHDTIYVQKNTAKEARAFSWNDNYVTVNGKIENDSVLCSVTSLDTIVQMVYEVPKKFLFFRCGTKSVKQTILSKNPHTVLTYSDYVEVKRE